jgi:hypothetical protein
MTALSCGALRQAARDRLEQARVAVTAEERSERLADMVALWDAATELERQTAEPLRNSESARSKP